MLASVVVFQHACLLVSVPAVCLCRVSNLQLQSPVFRSRGSVFPRSLSLPLLASLGVVQINCSFLALCVTTALADTDTGNGKQLGGGLHICLPICLRICLPTVKSGLSCLRKDRSINLHCLGERKTPMSVLLCNERQIRVTAVWALDS